MKSTTVSSGPARPSLEMLTALRAVLDGGLAVPGDPGYDLAMPWNRAVSVTPRAVVAAASDRDVVAAVGWARRHGLRVAVQRTGHGAVPVGDDTLLIHTAGLDEVTVHPEQRWARVGAGAVWQQLLDAATPHGLAPLCGAAPGVGIAGYLTGGGLGPLARTYGFSSDLVRALDVVTGDGELRRATPGENSDLFWGLRGGKATLGIVTAVEMDLPALSTIYGGSLWFDGAHAGTVMRAWRDVCRGLPHSGTTSLALAQLPPLPQVPPALAGRLTVGVRFAWAGDAEAGEAALAPIRHAATPLLDGVGAMPYAAVGSIHADPVEPMPAHEDHALLSGLPDAGIDTLVAAARTDNPQTLIELRLLGGAIAQEPRHRSAVSHRDAAFTLVTIGVPASTSDGPDLVAQHGARLVTAMGPWATGGMLPNFSASAESARVARCYDRDTLHRLTTLAERYDPDHVLATGQIVRGTADGQAPEPDHRSAAADGCA